MSKGEEENSFTALKGGTLWETKRVEGGASAEGLRPPSGRSGVTRCVT